MRDRHDKIVKLCAEFPLSLNVIAKALNVTKATIWNDSGYLISRGRVKNVSCHKNIIMLVSC